MPRPTMHEEALAAPLWYNTQLGTGAGVLVHGRAPRNKAAWRRFAEAGIVQIGDVFDTNTGRFVALADLRITRSLSPKSTQAEHDLLQHQIRRSVYGPHLARCSKPVEVHEWFTPDPSGPRTPPAAGGAPLAQPAHHAHDAAARPTDVPPAPPGPVYQMHRLSWEAYHPQTTDRVAHLGRHLRAEARSTDDHGAAIVDIGDTWPCWIPRAETRELTAEQWSPARFIHGRRQSPVPAAVTRVLAYTPKWDAADSVAGDAIVVGQLRHAAGSLPQHISLLQPRGRRLHGLAATKAALAQRAAHAARKRGLSAARRAWLLQKGPRPRWRHLFTRLRDTAMSPSTRAAGWAILQGSIVWGTQARKWAPLTGFCAHCSKAGLFTEDCALHFATCPANDRLWDAARDILNIIRKGPPPLRKWFVLYGPESSDVPRASYALVTIVWATLCRTMLRARTNTRLCCSPKAQRAVVNEFIAALREECRADYAAATSWTPPLDALHTTRRSPGQSRSFAGWAIRWRGLAQLRDGRIRWVTDTAYDHAAADPNPASRPAAGRH
jgi:hypothetical protein